MSYSQERADIETYLNANWTVTLIAWDNVTFLPAPGVPWIRCTILPADAEGLAFGKETDIQYSGIIDIGIFTPKGTGSDDARQYVDTLDGIFSMQNIETIMCDELCAQNLGIDKGWYHTSVTIPFSRIE